MSHDYVEIGSSPPEEKCVSVGEDDYERRAKAECRRYIALIRVVCGDEPDGAHLYVKANPHDFGTYYEVACSYETENKVAANYAYWVESDGPARWEEIAGSRLPPAPSAEDDRSEGAFWAQLEAEVKARYG